MSSPLGYDPGGDRAIESEDQAQQPLRDRQLRMLCETALDAIAIVDPQGRYLDVNPAACELFALEREELLGRCIGEFTEPEFNLLQLWQEFPHQEKVRGEFRIVQTNGEIRIVEYAATANYLPDCHLLVMRDLTECKQAEARIRELSSELAHTQAQLQEARNELVSIPTPTEGHPLDQIVHQIPGVIYQFRMRPDGTFHFPYANEGLRKIYGFSPEEVREDAVQIFTTLHPEDFDRVSQSILDSAEHLTPWYSEYRVCLPDGRMLWLSGHSTPQRQPDGSTLWHGYIQDITDRKLAEADNQRLLAILESTSDLIGTADLTGKTLYINQAWRNLFDNDRAKIANVEISTSHPQWALDIILNQGLPEAARSGLWQGETAIVDGAGREIPVSQVIVAHKSTDGNVEYFSTIVRDITESKATELALRQSEEKFRRIIENINDLVYIINPDRSFSYISPQFKEIRGYELTNLCEYSFGDGIYPEDLPICVDAIDRCLQGEKLRGIEYRILHQDGNYYWHSSNVSALRDEDGQVIACLGIARYIHEQKQAEIALQESNSRWQLAIEGAGDGTWDWNLKTNQAIFSRQWKAMLGYEEHEVANALEEWQSRLHPEDQAQCYEDFSKHFKGETVTYRNEHRLRCKDGSYKWILDRGQIVEWDEEGQPLRFIGTHCDISDRKEAEKNLRQNEQKYHQILDAITDMVLVKGPDSRIIWANKAFREYYGLTNEQLQDLIDTPFNKPDYALQYIRDDAYVFATGQSLEVEEPITRYDGEVKIFNTIKSVIRNDTGEKILTVGVSRDISDYKRAEAERKQAQAELKEAEQFLRSIYEAAGCLIFVVDLTENREILYSGWSLSAEKATDIKAADIIGKTPESVFGLTEGAALRQNYLRCIEAGTSISYEECIIFNQQETWWLTTLNPIKNSDNRISRVVGTAIDISDRKRQEQSLRLIVEGTAGKTGTEFFKSCVQYLAQVLEVRYAFIAEFADSEKMSAQTLAFWAQDGFADNFTYNLAGTPCKNVVRKGEVCCYHNSVQKLFPEDDDLVALQAESYAGLSIMDSAGHRLGLLAVLDTQPMQKYLEMQSDILKIFATRAGAEIERIQAETALRQKTQELETTLNKLQTTQTQLIQAEKMSSLGQLVAGIAHEINNPVSFIYSNIQPANDYASELFELINLYQKHYPSPPQAISELIENIELEYLVSDFSSLLESMKNGATRIRDIVKSLRTFSRLDEADFKEIDIHENIESTLVILQNRFNGRSGKPEIKIAKNYDKLPPIECYGGLLNQVFMNLLVNGIDAIEQQRQSLETLEKLDYIGMITITTSITSEDRVSISIHDNGCGMTPQVQEKIFNPFFTTKPVGKGTGMGLAISYQIVTENHHGNLQCFSTFGKGTEFRIELPIRNRKSS